MTSAARDVLRLSVRTVKAYRHVVMEKMQVRTLAELVSIAERVGFLGDASGRSHKRRAA